MSREHQACANSCVQGIESARVVGDLSCTVVLCHAMLCGAVLQVADIDFFDSQPFPKGFDVITMGMILHDMGVQKKRLLLQKVSTSASTAAEAAANGSGTKPANLHHYSAGVPGVHSVQSPSEACSVTGQPIYCVDACTAGSVGTSWIPVASCALASHAILTGTPPIQGVLHLVRSAGLCCPSAWRRLHRVGPCDRR